MMMEHLYKSQHGQDQWLYENIFKNYEKPGFFFEAGAADGVGMSNTWFFEKALGWKGILVEPCSGMFETLRENRSNCICLDCCLGPEGKEVEFIDFSEVEPTLSGVRDDQIHTPANWFHSHPGSGNPGKIIRKVCRGAAPILNDWNVEYIDLLSLDIEGFEYHVLMDLSDEWVNKIKVLMFEFAYLSKAQICEIEQKFKKPNRHVIKDDLVLYE